ncbi:MAG: efflux RND transporter permease subunit [Planctomycetia bacterium]|jgi:predicted RND superfamily exporter protein
MRPVCDRVANWLISHRNLLALVAVVLAIVSVERSRQLEFARSIDTMFDRSDPALVPYRRLGRAFGSSEVVLAAYDAPDLFTPAGIERLERLTDELATVPGVASATSLASTPLGSRIIELDESPTARKLVKLMEGYTIGADHRTAAIACVLAAPEPASTAGSQRAAARILAVSRAAAIDRIRAVMAPLPGGTVAGEPVMLRDGFAMLERDGNLLGTAAGLLAGAVLLVSFRSLRWLIVPLAVVLLALWSTRGVLAIIGLKLTMVSTMLSAMVTVVAIATVVHVIVEFRRQRDLGLPPAAALERAIGLLFWPVVGAIVTDIIGFGSLIFSQVGPVHDFGIMTAVGALMVLVAAALAVPFLALTGRFDADPKRAWGEAALDLGLDRLVKRIVRQPGRILGLSASLTALAVAGMAWLEVETDFTRNFRRSSAIVQSYNMVESRLGGAGVWDVLVPAGDTIDGAALSRLARLEHRLRDEVTATGPDGRPTPALTKVMSVADVLTAISPIALERLERTRLGNWLVTGAIQLLEDQLPQLGRTLIGRDPEDGSTWLRIMLRARERQPAPAKRAIIDTVRRIVAEECPASAGATGGEVTGFFVLLAQLIDRMLADQWFTFLLAAAGIFALLAIAFRSVVIAAVALVPNALPIFVVLGLLGWAGARMNMGTAMIAAVSMGLSVDSSIHYIAAFRRRLTDGHAVEAALETAHQTAGRAMVFSTLALVVGFLALTTSGFIPTVSFGALSCLTLVGGLVGNLVILPVLLTLVTRPGGQGFVEDEKPLQLAPGP